MPCKHGHNPRQCYTCDLESEVDRLEKENKQLRLKLARVRRPGPSRVSPLSRAVEPKTEAEETDPLPLPSY